MGNDKPTLNRHVEGRTPLMHASFAGDLGEVTALLDRGADPNARDEGGDTALMFAAMGGRSAAVRLLLARGADPLARARNGWTALRFAVSRGHDEIAGLLGLAEERAYQGELAKLDEEFGRRAAE